MPTSQSVPAKPRGGKAVPLPDAGAVVARLRKMGSQKVREGMARFAIPSDRAFGIAMADMQRLAKELGTSHGLAQDLWRTGWYEARTVAAFVEEIDRVTPAQMDRWAADFDNWAICDTVCFKLFDRSPHAFAKVEKWAKSREEYVKRAAFALLASVALHDRSSADERFLPYFPMLEAAASDERNFVKKAVLWALRAVGERSVDLHGEALRLATRLADSPIASARWIGRAALRELEGSAAATRLSKKSNRKAATPGSKR